MTDAHLYIHVPFCLSKCGYCAFYSEPHWDDHLLDRYADAVVTEFQTRVGKPRSWKTAYFGGGTPSLLGPKRVVRILSAVAGHESLDDTEVTLEANPETVTLGLLKDLRSAGVNRLSLGLQSLDDAELRYLGRAHDVRRGREALEAALRTFDRVSIDLIYGLRGQTVESWLRTLHEAAGLGPGHLSAYELTLDPGTPLGDAGSDAPGHADFFFATHECLAELGFQGYEVSNFARSPAARSRHNLATWAYRPYLGFGPGAHSLERNADAAIRRFNRPALADYLAGARTGSVPHEKEPLTPPQQLLERLMLGLRTDVGLDLSHIRHLLTEAAADSLASRLSRLETQGLLRLDNDHIRPTLRGMALADGLAAELSG
jgi:oxygen-independent coproporphyrinogen III oxidase